MEVTFLLFFVIFVVLIINPILFNQILSFQCTQHLLHLGFHHTSTLGIILHQLSHFPFHIIIPTHLESGYLFSTMF